MGAVGYRAGSEADLPHLVKIVFTSGENVTRSDLIVRWIEFWCQMNCEAEWRVTEYDTHVDIHFADEVDVVHFKLSPEFNFS